MLTGMRLKVYVKYCFKVDAIFATIFQDFRVKKASKIKGLGIWHLSH